MKKKLFIVGALLVAGCASPSPTPRTNVTLLGPAGQAVTVSAEIADEPKEREQGLMFRKHLPRDEGMLFVFETPAVLSFWMKNTLIPLDIAFFDAKGNFVSSASMEPCNADPCPQYRSNGEAVYALEVAAGFLANTELGPGWALLAGQKSE